MFHACVQRFDVMDEKILGGELNRALLKLKYTILTRDKTEKTHSRKQAKRTLRLPRPNAKLRQLMS